MFFLNPEDILSQIDLKEDMVAASFGFGSAKFAIPLAKKLKNGLVLAIDAKKEKLNFLKSQSLFQKIDNLDIAYCDLSKEAKLKGSFFDLVLAVDILFQAKDKSAIINEIKKGLKKEGIFLAIEKKHNLYPRHLLLMTKEFKRIKDIDCGDHYYGIVFKKI